MGKVCGAPHFSEVKTGPTSKNMVLSDIWLVLPFARVGASWVTTLSAWKHFPSGQTDNVLKGFLHLLHQSPAFPHSDCLDIFPASQFLPLWGPWAVAAPQSLLCSATSKYTTLFSQDWKLLVYFRSLSKMQTVTYLKLNDLWRREGWSNDLLYFLENKKATGYTKDARILVLHTYINNARMPLTQLHGPSAAMVLYSCTV